jgi:chromate reductase
MGNNDLTRTPARAEGGREMRVSAICGSMRAGSFNQALLDTVQVAVDGFPLFCADRESDPPEDVLAAKELISSTSCILLVSPEHNYGVPGMLKNAVDWLSRPSGDPTLRKRPMAVMGASSGYMGTVRAQMAWRQMWHYFGQPVFSGAEMFLSFAAHAVEDGRVTDPGSLERLDDYLQRLAEWLEERDRP